MEQRQSRETGEGTQEFQSQSLTGATSLFPALTAQFPRPDPVCRRESLQVARGEEYAGAGEGGK